MVITEPRRTQRMYPDTLLIFLPACFAINMSPGPNNLLALSNGSRFGFLAAVAGGSGRLLAFGAMITLASFGLAAILQASAWLFLAIKTVGGLYLLWLAWKLWHASVDNIDSLTRHDPWPFSSRPWPQP